MRNVVLSLAVFILTSPSAPAQSWAEKMFKDGTNHEFGSVPRGGVLFHRFVMTNIYAVPLDITSMTVSCGQCSSASASAKTIPPKGTANIDVFMDTRKFTAYKQVHVTLWVGPQFISKADLTVSANSRNDIVLNPGQISFGVVPRGEAPTSTIDVEYAGTFDWKASKVVATGLPGTATFEEQYRRPGQVGYRVIVKMNPDAPSGPFKQEIRLETNDPTTPSIPILVEGIIQPPLTLAPEVLSGINLNVGEEQVKRVFVRGSKSFRILSVEGQGEGLDVTTPLPTQAASSQSISLKIHPGKPGEFKRELQIKTDLGDASVTLKVEGEVTP